MKKRLAVLIPMMVALMAGAALAQEATLRLYQGVTAYVNNPGGKAFEVTADVRDWNLMENGPSELLFKIYDPDGVPVVRKLIPDDGVTGHAYMPESGGWEHEMWYYLLSYERGSQPMIRWSSFTESGRLAALPKRTFRFPIPKGKKGVYRVLVVGNEDLVVTFRLAPALPFALAGHPLWMHGHGDMFKRSYVYLPRGTLGLSLGFAEFDQPVTRRFTVTAPDGTVLWTGSATGGLQKAAIDFTPPGRYDDQLLTVDVSEGGGDYMMQFLLNRNDVLYYRGIASGGTPALYAPDCETAMALKGGAIYHDGLVFWHGFQVRFHDWLKTIPPGADVIRNAQGVEVKPAGTKNGSEWWTNAKEFSAALPPASGFVLLNGVHEPPPLSDVLMHNYAQHKNTNVLNAALRELAEGFRSIAVGEIPVNTHGNMAYAFSTYGWHWWRPAWRVLRQSDASPEVKDIVREALILCGDRLAFSRGVERCNGNSLSHIPMALRYAAEGAQDPLLTDLANTYFDRFANHGWGDRVGISKSGDCQEHFAHDYHYGTYIMANYAAITNDLPDPRFQGVLDRIRALYDYLYCEEANAFPWDSRTHEEAPIHVDDWKAKPGPDFTVSVNGGNEWFAARRRNYYILTFHGKLAPEWLNHYFDTRLGYGGGMICQLTVPGKGTVLAATLPASYGEGMETRNWPNFHIHSLVGTLANGAPLVAADGEHLDARLEGNTVSGSGEVRDRPVRALRRYTFAADRIACGVQLADTDYRQSYFPRVLPIAVAEAYEMIPFVNTKVKPATVKTAEGMLLGGTPASTAGVTIDRGGFGVKIEFDRARPVTLGTNDTVLVQLTNTNTPADKVGFQYTLIPY